MCLGELVQRCNLVLRLFGTVKGQHQFVPIADMDLEKVPGRLAIGCRRHGANPFRQKEGIDRRMSLQVCAGS